MEQSVVFTDSAAAKVSELVSEEGNPNLKLRVYVVGGGCSGFQYGFAFDEKQNDDDFVIQKNSASDCEESGEESSGGKGVSLVIDALSMNYLKGAEIDYSEGLQGAHFVVRNPNATTTCGCGSSFAI